LIESGTLAIMVGGKSGTGQWFGRELPEKGLVGTNPPEVFIGEEKKNHGAHSKGGKWGGE